jgi:hypothetical protein
MASQERQRLECKSRRVQISARANLGACKSRRVLNLSARSNTPVADAPGSPDEIQTLWFSHPRENRSRVRKNRGDALTLECHF